ncbi:MAG: hypothetical protein JWL81_3403, partial [Verrucomicrobiales bacterium]|nr:hypothetical protein [Verrucomicrobiales bacterium]
MKITFLAMSGLLLLRSVAPAQLTPLFKYQFPASYAGSAALTPDVTDTSPAGGNGTVLRLDGLADPLELSDSVPPGAPAGAKSLDLAAVTGAILTNGKKLLDRPTLHAAGGFTMDLWFNGVPTTTSTAFQKIMDDSGTDFIAVNGADTDADGKFRQAIVRVGGGAGNTFYLDIDDGLEADGWNHITVAYAVTGGTTTTPIGTVTVVLNGVVRIYPNRSMVANTTYTGYNRPVGLGRHPVFTEYYAGLVYNPCLYLGTEPVAFPSLLLTTSGAAGFSATLKDGVSPVVTSSITATLNGTAITLNVSEFGDTRELSYAPVEPLPGGVYSLVINFSDASGPRTETRSFNVVGDSIVPVFDYQFPASYDGTAESTIVADQSTGLNNGTISGVVPLSDDVPPGAPAGTKSLDSTLDNGFILTDAKKLLNSAAVVASGGFTMGTWFKGIPAASTTAFQKVIDYAGTEFIALNGLDSDNDGSFGQLVVRLSATNADILLDADNGLLPEDWNHVEYSFKVTDGTDLANLVGTVTITLNGHRFSYTGRVKTSFGDSLDRVTGIGRHPTFTSEYYRGLLYRPTAFLGVRNYDGPTLGIAASRVAGNATLTIQDGAGGLLVPASLVVKVDGAALVPSVSVSGNITTAVITPLVPFTPGRHTAAVSFSDDSGNSYYFSAPFIIAGSEFLPLLSYRFPDSYNGGGNGQTVFDVSGVGNDAVATGTTVDLPVAVSADVPAEAEAGLQSVSFIDTPGTLATTKRKLLNRPLVTAAGGYTFDVWFKGVQGATVQKVLDYAGTEYIGTRDSNADGDANAGEVIISV